MNYVARKMWGIHDAVRVHKTRRHFRLSLTSIQNIPKRELYGCPSRL